MDYVFSYKGITSMPNARNVVLKIDKPIIPVSSADYIIPDDASYTYFLVPRDGNYLFNLNISHTIGSAGADAYNGLSLRIIQNYTNQPLSDAIGQTVRGQQAYGVMSVISGIFPLRKGTAVFAVAGKATSNGPASALFSGALLVSRPVTGVEELAAVEI